MVEGNENNTDAPESGNSTPKRRGGLFGARRGGRGRAGQERAELTGQGESPAETVVERDPVGGDATVEGPVADATDAAQATTAEEHAAAASDAETAAEARTSTLPSPRPSACRRSRRP